MGLQIDSESPVPLYHQIAEAIRERIRSGALAPGEALEPMRQAAGRWGVNLHTVRHAYAALAREGLVERGRGRAGTRVLGPLPSSLPPDPRDLDRFLDRMRREARDQLGLGTRDLFEALRERLGEGAGDRPIVYVVECSEWQCRCHAREISGRWNVDTRPWPLTVKAEPPDAPLISTYFHYNDIRRLWPRRLSEITFLALHPDPSLRRRLAGRHRRVLVFGRDGSAAASIMADLRSLFARDSVEFEPLVGKQAASIFPLKEAGPPVLFSPRAWAALGNEERSHRRALELRYLIDEADLEKLGAARHWAPPPAAEG
jgi:hypothetical protein